MSYKVILATALIGLSMVGCGGGGGTDAGTGDLSLSITDAPVDGADAVVVFFDAVTVQSGGGSRQT